MDSLVRGRRRRQKSWCKEELNRMEWMGSLVRGGGEGRARNVDWPAQDTSLLTRLHRNVDQSWPMIPGKSPQQSWPMIQAGKIWENLWISDWPKIPTHTHTSWPQRSVGCFITLLKCAYLKAIEGQEKRESYMFSLAKMPHFTSFPWQKCPPFTSFPWGKSVPSICFNLLPSRPPRSLLFPFFSVFLVTNSSPFTFTSPHSPVASNSSCFYQPTSHKQLGMRPHKSDRDQQQHQYGVTPIIHQFCPVVTNFAQVTNFDQFFNLPDAGDFCHTWTNIYGVTPQ